MNVVALPQERKSSTESRTAPAFAELAVTSNFSFLHSGSTPEELVGHAVRQRILREVPPLESLFAAGTLDLVG